jgi:hypothetical protein
METINITSIMGMLVGQQQESIYLLFYVVVEELD